MIEGSCTEAPYFLSSLLSQSPALYDFELPCHPFRGNLESAGLVQRNTNGSIEAQGKQYTVRQTRQGMGVIKNDQSAGVLANPDGTITQAVNLTEADRQNWEISASRSSENLDALKQQPQKSNTQPQPSSDIEL